MNPPARLLSSAACRSRRRFEKGFALIITLLLMGLLTLIAVGLLSLSAISLRTTTGALAKREAEANARLALMLAIGELQKSLGPDRAVTANSGLLKESPAKPKLMGVWESWDDTAELQGSGSGPNYQKEQQTRFKGWMVSTSARTEATAQEFADSPWKQPTIELAGAASYGGKLPASGPLVAGRIALTKEGRDVGGYAWHVSDESQKSRIMLFRDPSESDTLARKRALLSGHRSYACAFGEDLAFLGKDSDSHAFELAKRNSQLVTGLAQAELSGPDGLDRLKPLRDEVSPYSLGVLADVRLGGLKKDLSSMFEVQAPPGTGALPSAYADKSLYASALGISGESDPQWTRLSSCYNLFKQLTDADTRPLFKAAPLENIVLPRAGAKPAQPNYFAPGPVIAKVQVLFSILTRPPHGRGPDNGRDGQMHIIYTPIITLYNPYNVRISFDMLEVAFQSLPLGFNVQLDGTALTGGKLIPFNELYDQGRTQGAIAKSIVLKISNWKGFDTTVTEPNGGKPEAQIMKEADKESSDPKDPIVMEPGQTLLCCPYIDPNSQFGQSGAPNAFFDFGNQLTRSIKTKPGFFGNSVGYDIDWLNHSVVQYSRSPKNTAIGITCGAAKPTLGGNASFEVTAKLTVGGKTRSYGGLQLVYPALSDLEKVIKQTQYATTAQDCFVPNEGGGDALLSRHSGAKPFVLFTAAARTTSGGVNEAGARARTSAPGKLLLNGIYAGKPFLFNNAAAPVTVTNLKNDRGGAQSYELSIQPVTRSTVSKLLQNDSRNRTRFITGNTPDLGIKSGTMYEVPSGPMLAIADFRRTNVLASGFAPNFTQPIANSIVPPVMNTESAAQAGASYRLLDHSALANQALYDSFYFSTFATDGSRSPADCFSDFVAGTHPLPSQAFVPHLDVGVTPEGAAADLFSGGFPADTTYQKAAAYQMVCGPFNVNSTSVQAWKARLSALRDSNIPLLDLKGSPVQIEGSKDTPILAMTLPNAAAADPASAAASDPEKEAQWTGFRQLNDRQMDELATRIVQEVRKRGPFLSMADFVNRRMGPNSDETRKGALEAAIEEAQLNEHAYPGQVPVSDADITGDDYGFLTPEVVTGNPAAGAPTWLTQGDLMKLLEPAATVRSDTFVIRVCGESTRDGQVVRAFAEAVIQRMPEYVDDSMKPFENAVTSDNRINKAFGRRMEVVSFRWLSNDEI